MAFATGVLSWSEVRMAWAGHLFGFPHRLPGGLAIIAGPVFRDWPVEPADSTDETDLG
jgi:hypothetical protein